MTPERLIYMANQIACAFRSEGEARAIEDTADHLRRFWDPRMRKALADFLAAGGKGLDAVAQAAVARL